jgi:hypothetical protein
MEQKLLLLFQDTIPRVQYCTLVCEFTYSTFDNIMPQKLKVLTKEQIISK